jgi:hypothetical protein
MEMRCWFDGVNIEEVGPDYLNGFRSNPVEMMEHGNRVYAVTGTGWIGFIVGGIVSTLEDNGDPLGPSGLTGDLSDGHVRLLGGKQ